MPRVRAVAWLALAVVVGCARGGPETRELHVDVTSAGFVPARKVVPKDRPLVLVFTRKTDQTCATDVVFPSLHRGYDLPMNTPVRVELSAAELRDTLFYNCSMNMISGMLVPK